MHKMQLARQKVLKKQAKDSMFEENFLILPMRCSKNLTN